MIRYFYIPGRYIYTVGLLVSCLVFFFGGCGKRTVPFEVMPVAVEDRLYAEAEKSLKAGDYEKALVQYQAYTTQYPYRPLSDDAVMKMASIHLANGRYQEARDQYQRVLDDYSDGGSAPDAQVEILATFYHQGDYAALFERIGFVNVGALPRTARVRLHKMMGDAHLSSGHVKKAVDAYALSLSCYPEKERGETTPEMAAAIDELDPRDIEALLGGGRLSAKSLFDVSFGAEQYAGRMGPGCQGRVWHVCSRLPGS